MKKSINVKRVNLLSAILIFQALYEQSLHIKSAIPHPLIMGVIRGKNIIGLTVFHLIIAHAFIFTFLL